MSFDNLTTSQPAENITETQQNIIKSENMDFAKNLLIANLVIVIILLIIGFLIIYMTNRLVCEIRNQYNNYRFYHQVIT
jgi:hypothetical protein